MTFMHARGSPTFTYLNGDHESVAQMQGACDIGRRDDHHKLLSALRLNRLKEAAVLPPGIPAPASKSISRGIYSTAILSLACPAASLATCRVPTGRGAAVSSWLMPHGSQGKVSSQAAMLLQVL